jgi:type II secretory ATPase GspE/PulE/Tfp pilus assembly ATPase PilB-like protein
MLSSVTGEKAVLQVLRETHMDRRRLDELGMLDGQLATLKSALEQRSGLIVLCGPPPRQWHGDHRVRLAAETRS